MADTITKLYLHLLVTTISKILESFFFMACFCLGFFLGGVGGKSFSVSFPVLIWLCPSGMLSASGGFGCLG